MDATMLLVWVVVGAIVGWLASVVTGTNVSQGLLGDIMVGIIGGILGGFLLGALGIGGAVISFNIASMVIAFVGKVGLLLILQAVRGTARV